MTRALRSAALLIAAAVLAAFVAAVGPFTFGRVEWPAYPSSNVLGALTTLGQVVLLAVLGALLVAARRGRGGVWVKLGASSTLAALVTTTLGLPLAATKLYLHGVSVDQEFRTEYLTRLADSPHLADMTYANLPPYYPAGWFWVGGRMADALSMPGWEAFKPFAIGSLAVAAAVTLMLWTELVRLDRAIVVATAVAMVVLTYGSPEPYGAAIVMLLVPGLLLSWAALHRDRGGWAAVAGTGVILGAAACVYTLYFGWGVAAVGFMAVVAAWAAYRRRRTWRAVGRIAVRLIVIGAVAGVGALLVWAPYLREALRGAPAESGTATHYLPESGARLAFPMIDFSLMGALALIGTGWLVLRATSSRRAQALGLGVVSVYLWSLGSMAYTALGNTLLGFRLEPVLLALLAAAGTFGVLDALAAVTAIAASRSDGTGARTARTTRLVAVSLAALATLAFVQDIPRYLRADINIAYSDTDGDGARGDRRSPSAVALYPQVDAAIAELTGKAPRDLVVLTGDTSLLAFQPYWGFLGRTSHYANPLAEYDARRTAVSAWADLGSSDEFAAALDTLAWRAPDVFVLRRTDDGYRLRLGQDVYPNDPNVRMYQVDLPARLFDGGHFRTTNVGPFAVIARTR